MITNKDNKAIAKLIVELEKFRVDHLLDGVKVYFANETNFTIKGIRNDKIVCCIRTGREHLDLKEGTKNGKN